MPTIDELLDEVFAGQERVSRDEIHRRAVAADLAADDLGMLDALPEGEYSLNEAAEAIGLHLADTPAAHTDVLADGDEGGVPAEDLSDDDLLRELASLHNTRHETFLHASTQAAPLARGATPLGCACSARVRRPRGGAARQPGPAPRCLRTLQAVDGPARMSRP